MYNLKEIFSRENFDEENLTDLIYSAMDVYEGETRFNRYIWVSLDTLEAEKGAWEIKEFEGLENGFIVEITEKPEEDIWDCVVRSFVEYFNENFDRGFDYKERYDPYVEENDEAAFTNWQLQSVFESCHNYCIMNRYEEDTYYIMVDMEKYEAVKVVKEIEHADDKYEFVEVDPLDKVHGLTDIYDNCTHAIMFHFDTDFEMNMVYDFEIAEFD